MPAPPPSPSPACYLLFSAHLLEDKVVVSSAQTTVSSDDDHHDGLNGADAAQRRIDVLGAETLVNSIQDL